MKKILAILMVSLMLVCSICTVSAADYAGIQFDSSDGINIVIMGGSQLFQDTTHLQKWTGDNVMAGQPKTWINKILNQIVNETCLDANNPVFYGKDVNLYLVGEKGDTAADGALKVASEVMPLNPDLVILAYGSDYRADSGITPAESKIYMSKIFKTMYEYGDKRPYAWTLLLPNDANNCTMTEQNTVAAKYCGKVLDLASGNPLNSSDYWEENGNLTQYGHDTMFSQIWNGHSTNSFLPAVIKASTRLWRCGNSDGTAANDGISGNKTIFGKFTPASEAVADGFTVNADGSVTSNKAGATLSFDLTGLNYAVYHANGDIDYTIAVDGGIPVTVDTAYVSSYKYLSGNVANEYKTHRAVITADEGVTIKGFYDTPVYCEAEYYIDSTDNQGYIKVNAYNTQNVKNSEGGKYNAFVVHYDENGKFLGIDANLVNYLNNANGNCSAVREYRAGASKFKVLIWDSYTNPLGESMDFVEEYAPIVEEETN